MIKHIIFGFVLLGLVQCREAERTQATKNDSAVTTSNSDSELLAKSIVAEAQATLGGALQQQIAKNGIPAAISYCNVNALPITDSIAKAKGVQIQRVTDKPRNAVNRVNLQEKAIMEQVRQAMSGTGQTTQFTSSEEGVQHHYFPIVTADFCLKCHGVPGQTMPAENERIITQYYPNDQARGYEANELRGLWKVTFLTPEK